jgi:hypothetical protein
VSWHVFAASATGSGHAETGLPCQDAFAHEVAGDVLCAVICDGAGSAAASDLGSRRLASRVVQELMCHGGARADFLALGIDALRDELVAVVGSVRGELQACADAAGLRLNDYAATLVGVVATGDGGWLFHVGDGVGAARSQNGAAAEIISLPENGEYANETYFVTGDEWQAHLRLLPITAPVETIALMSDGAAPFVMQRGLTGLFRPFLDPVEQYLSTATPEAGDAALSALLGDPRTHAITSDDKTLLIARWQE